EKVVNGSPVTSRPFHVSGYDWLIQCYPNGYKKKSKGCISLYLLRQDSHAKTDVVMASYKMSILNTCWKPSCTRTSLEEEHYTNNALGWEEFMKHENLDKEKHLKDDCLYILCDVSVDLGLHTGDYNDEIAAAEETKPAPSELEEAIWNKQASDVKTNVSAHRWLRLICWPFQD
uniref:MATH domain-containing protein n=1 Tax=Aegilops tauschii subsp. strangulata TaxID=200361 RepID=A0A453QHX9_AEGTS